MPISLRQTWKAIALMTVLGVASSCTPTNTPQSSAVNNRAVANTNAPKVVATTTILCDMVRTIAQETVNLTCLLQPGVDAHVYASVPEDRRAIEEANLILYSGYGFEPGLIKLIQSTSNPAPKVAVAEVAVPNPIMGSEHHHGHTETKEPDEHDHDHDKEAGEKTTPDPHVWQSAENGAQMARVVQDNLARIAPDNRELYAQNAQRLEIELTAIHNWIKSQIATIPASSRKLTTTHEAMAYFSEAYNIPLKGALQGISTDEKPTAQRVRQLVDEIKAANVPTIFAEVVVNPRLIETVARDAKVTISDRPLYSDSIGEPGSEGETYPKMLIANTRTIVEGLNGQYVAFQPK